MRRYWLAAAALGLAATWGSENLFWSAPPADLSAVGLTLTWVAYSLCAAAALSAVLWSGLQGWRAALLGGALLGWLIEGVVVATMYDAFPFQVVWTPMAWHALVTGVGVVGVGRMAGRWSTARMAAAWAGLGAWAGLFALWWPLERDDLPIGWAAVAQLGGYLVLLGLAVPAGQLTLDRLGSLTAPSRRALLVAPVLLGLLWLLRVAFAPSPLYVALPVVLLPTLWVMRRLGSPGRPLELGAAATPWKHLLFLLTPAVATLVATVGWTVTDGVPTNAPVALGGCLAALWLYGGSVRAAVRRRPS
jgi:hypothetical protein